MEKTIRVIHLEDKRFDADMVKRELAKDPGAFELCWVSDKKTFQQALLEFSPDIILSDHSLPSFTSRQALKMARDSGLDIPFILITATMSDEDAVALLKDGVSDYMLKDRIHRLRPSMQNALDRYHNEREMQKYHDEISRNERLFRAMIENNADMITLSHPEKGMLYASPSLSATLGFTKEELFGRPGMDFIHPDDRQDLVQLAAALLKKPGVSIYRKHRILHKNGSYIWCEGTMTNLLHDPNVGALVSNFRDITQRQLAEEELILQQRRLKEAQHIGHMGSWEIDMASGIHSWSKEMYNIMGIERGVITPSSELFISLIHPDDREMAVKKIEETFVDLKESSFLFRIITRGVMRYGYSEYRFEFGPDNKPLRLYGIVQDITEQKLAEENLELEVKTSKRHQSQLLSSQINPHFIFNALNSVQYFMLLKEDTELALNFVAEFSLLMRATLKNSSSEFIPISDEVKFLELYLGLEQKRLQKKFTYEILVDAELTDEGVHVPPMVIQPYLENAVLHGISNSDRTNKITIAFSKTEERLICSIRDNGIGRRRAAELKGSDPGRKQHESMGMKITGTRIDLLNDLYEGTFEVKINDLLDDSGEALGTEVQFILPVIDEEMIEDMYE